MMVPGCYVSFVFCLGVPFSNLFYTRSGCESGAIFHQSTYCSQTFPNLPCKQYICPHSHSLQPPNVGHMLKYMEP